MKPKQIKDFKDRKIKAINVVGYYDQDGYSSIKDKPDNHFYQNPNLLEFECCTHITLVTNQLALSFDQDQHGADFDVCAVLFNVRIEEE